jgi:flagellar biosynthesis protein FlgN
MGNNTPATALADFAARMEAECNALRAFVALLETEQQTLLSGESDPLLALADSKVEAVHELNNLAQARNNDLLAFGAETGSGGLETWLQENAAGSLPVWYDIRQLAMRAQQLNNTNGELIRIKLRHNQQALAALHNAANNADGLYGPDGQPHLPTSGRTLGSV